LRLTLSVPLKC